MSYTERLQAAIMLDVLEERRRQDALKATGKFHATMADSMNGGDLRRLAILSEEFGEVARVVNEAAEKPKLDDVQHLRDELIQVAACCLAWCEWIDGTRADLYKLKCTNCKNEFQAHGHIGDDCPACPKCGGSTRCIP